MAVKKEKGQTRTTTTIKTHAVGRNKRIKFIQECLPGSLLHQSVSKQLRPPGRCSPPQNPIQLRQYRGCLGPSLHSPSQSAEHPVCLLPCVRDAGSSSATGCRKVSRPSHVTGPAFQTPMAPEAGTVLGGVCRHVLLHVLEDLSSSTPPQVEAVPCIPTIMQHTASCHSAWKCVTHPSWGAPHCVLNHDHRHTLNTALSIVCTQVWGQKCSLINELAKALSYHTPPVQWSAGRCYAQNLISGQRSSMYR